MYQWKEEKIDITTIWQHWGESNTYRKDNYRYDKPTPEYDAVDMKEGSLQRAKFWCVTGKISIPNKANGTTTNISKLIYELFLPIKMMKEGNVPWDNIWKASRTVNGNFFFQYFQSSVSDLRTQLRASNGNAL